MMGLLARLSYNSLLDFIDWHLSLLLSIGIGATTYFIIVYFMKMEEVDSVVNTLKRRVKRAF